jgi:hypothetical protein
MYDFLLAPLALLYLFAVAFLVSQIRPPRPGGERFPAPRRDRAAPPGDASLRLWIQGTERAVVPDAGFVCAFGVDRRTLRDLRIYARGGDLESFPTALIALLFSLYREGAVRGVDAMALLFHGRALAEGEALYFALVDVPPEPRVVAFLDRRRERHAAGTP